VIVAKAVGQSSVPVLERPFDRDRLGPHPKIAR
jgi:hypothetical protein